MLSQKKKQLANLQNLFNLQATRIDALFLIISSE